MTARHTQYAIAAVALLASAVHAATARYDANADASEIVTASAVEPYKLLKPAVVLQIDSLSAAISAIESGLKGQGLPSSRQKAIDFTCAYTLLPSLDGVDTMRPAYGFLLGPHPMSALPDPAVSIPVADGGAEKLAAAFSRKYRSHSGGGLMVFSDPYEDKGFARMYLAVADGRAMISPNLDCIKWLAAMQMKKQFPELGKMRGAPVVAHIDGELGARALDILSGFKPGGDSLLASAEATASSTPLNLHELSVALKPFESVDLAFKANVLNWNFTVRGTFENTNAPFLSIGTPQESWTDLLPSTAIKRSVSALPALVAELPAESRLWLASLAENTRTAGFGVIPACGALDAAIAPCLKGAGTSMFVVDAPGKVIGSVSVYELSDPATASKTIAGYFAADGGAKANDRVTLPSSRKSGSDTVFAYKTSFNNNEGQANGPDEASEEIFIILDMTYVDVAVKGDRLVVARGAPGLIDQWLATDKLAPWKTSLSSLYRIMPTMGMDETLLGGGSVDLSKTAERAFGYSHDLAAIGISLPHAGDGFSWRMSRNGKCAFIDLSLSNTELVALRNINALDKAKIHEFFANYAVNHFQRQVERAPKANAKPGVGAAADLIAPDGAGGGPKDR